MSNLYSVIIAYIIFVLILYFARPNLIYDHKHNCFRQYGLGQNQTVLSFNVLSILFAVIIYLLITLSNKIELKIK